MPWKPIDPAQIERERMRRLAMEAARPKNHNRAYKHAAWKAIRVKKLAADPVCEFCGTAAPWDNRWENLRSTCKPCHSARTIRDRMAQRVSRRSRPGEPDQG
jgi:hypothetical protein